MDESERTTEPCSMHRCLSGHLHISVDSVALLQDLVFTVGLVSHEATHDVDVARDRLQRLGVERNFLRQSLDGELLRGEVEEPGFLRVRLEVVDVGLSVLLSELDLVVQISKCRH